MEKIVKNGADAVTKAVNTTVKAILKTGAGDAGLNNGE